MTAQTILPANTLSSGFDVANSARFESAQLLRTNSGSTATDIDKYTISVWLKRSKLGVDSNIIADTDGSNNYYQIYFKSDDTIRWQEYLGGSQSGALITNRKFRDVGAWYNLIFRYDSSLGTAGDRMRMYVNGVEETSFSTDVNPDQNANGHFGEASSQKCIADNNADGREYFGYMSEFMGVDGQSLAPDQFGEFDGDSGIWKPIDISGITQGVHGFYLKFEDSSDLGVATLGSNWTGAGLAATDQSTDTCTNNFAVLNPLVYGTNYTWSEGNLQFVQTATNWRTTYSSIAVTKGKWYMEFKGKVGAYYDIGVTDVVDPTNNLTVNSGCVAYKSNGEFAAGGAVGDGLPSTITTPASNTYTANDIMGIALDMDNETVYFAKNGTYEVNSDPTSGASKTGGTDLPNSNSLYFFAFAAYKGSAATGTAQVNFGGGSVDAISSGNADADGHGNFEFAVPSGYFALCTKNLAEYG